MPPDEYVIVPNCYLGKLEYGSNEMFGISNMLLFPKLWQSFIRVKILKDQSYISSRIKRVCMDNNSGPLFLG
jgi:hypothetical protein